MPVSPRLIRGRIRSVTNTRKITKAMEMVAAAKMRKAVSAVLATRPYAESAWHAVEEIAKTTDSALHPLLKSNDATGKALVIIFAPDRGLCGGVISRLNREISDFVETQKDKPDFVAVGKKGVQFVGRNGLELVAGFDDLTKDPHIAEIRPIARLATDDYVSGKYSSVHIAFTDYKSAANQEAVVRQLLPLGKISGLGEAASGLKGVEETEVGTGTELDIDQNSQEFLFEPSPQIVLDMMIPRLVEVQIWQALLESLASEHAARMMAMRTASDAASDMITDLSLTLNQARQAAITQEIAEISSGSAVLG